MIKIGMVGAGIIANAHKQAIGLNEGCILAAVCDIVLERAEKLAEGTNAEIYTDYRKMAEEAELDGVIINLPHFLHMDCAFCFMENKIPTLIEKPMAMTKNECEKMIEVSERTGTPLAVGHVQKYFAPARYLRKLTEEGKLGRLCAYREIRNKDYFHDRPAWFFKKEQAGGGILMNYGAHAMDRLTYITGESVEKVCAFGNNFITDDNIEASAQLLLKLTSGATAALTFCGCLTPGFDECCLYYTNATAKIVGCDELWMSFDAKPFEKVELQKNDIINMQMVEFIKFIKGEENELVTPSYGKKVITVLEEAVNQITK